MKKLLLLHGWNWKNYPQFNTGSPWNDRSNFVKTLQNEYEVDTPSIPGFGDSDIPKIPWSIDNYVKWLNSLISIKNMMQYSVIHLVEQFLLTGATHTKKKMIYLKYYSCLLQ